MILAMAACKSMSGKAFRRGERVSESREACEPIHHNDLHAPLGPGDVREGKTASSSADLNPTAETGSFA